MDTSISYGYFSDKYKGLLVWVLVEAFQCGVCLFTQWWRRFHPFCDPQDNQWNRWIILVPILGGYRPAEFSSYLLMYMQEPSLSIWTEYLTDSSQISSHVSRGIILSWCARGLEFKSWMSSHLLCTSFMSRGRKRRRDLLSHRHKISDFVRISETRFQIKKNSFII